jgi:hypothetical protein
MLEKVLIDPISGSTTVGNPSPPEGSSTIPECVSTAHKRPPKVPQLARLYGSRMRLQSTVINKR